MTIYEEIKDALVWRPILAGLEVHEPQTVLEVNLGWGEWDQATKDMDEVASYANRHPEVLP